MIEAVLKNCAVQPERGRTVLYCAFEYEDGGCGVTVTYDWFNEKFDHKAFLEDLKENVAKELDIPAYRVSFDAKKLLHRMEHWAVKFAKMGFLINDGGYRSRLILPSKQGLLH